MNGFEKLFKPKYVSDPNDVVYHDSSMYNYHERNWTLWTKYNPIWQDNDNEELGSIIIIIIIIVIIIIRFIYVY